MEISRKKLHIVFRNSDFFQQNLSVVFRSWYFKILNKKFKTVKELKLLKKQKKDIQLKKNKIVVNFTKKKVLYFNVVAKIQN